MRLVLGLVAMLLVTLGAGTAMAQDGRWLRAESPNFIVYGQTNERTLRQAAQTLEDFDTTLRTLTNASLPPLENKLEVYLTSRAGLDVVSPAISNRARGFYTASTQQVAAFLVYNDNGGLAREQVLMHEYAHHFMRHHFPYAYPAWYVEGWAEYVSTTEFEGRRAIVGTPSLRGWTITDGGGLAPVRSMLSPPSEAFMRRQEFYATAWLMTAYALSGDVQRSSLTRYLEALGEGGDPIERFESSFGMTIAEFEQALAEFGRGRTAVISMGLPNALAEVGISRLPAAADELLLLVARMKSEQVTATEAPSLAAAVEAAAASHWGDPYAERAAARAAMLRFDNERARQRLRALLAVHENDAEAHYLHAATYLQEFRQTRAEEPYRHMRRSLRRAFELAPNDVGTLFLYYVITPRSSPGLEQRDLDVLGRTVELAPQVTHLRFAFARELMLAQRHDAAIAVLRPLMYSAHAPETAEQAREYVRAAAERQAPPPSS